MNFPITYSFCTPVQTFGDLVCLFISIINLLIPILISLAVLGFFWGVFQYGFTEGKIEEGKKIMTFGVIAIFVMVSIWGILRVLAETFLGA
ncbi:MAG: hypothetical protein OQJ98_01630 [Candidatus Pacebacteria bacterium]|nr:hypothetical protein [Candidatus Paceibacterota bacterium]